MKKLIIAEKPKLGRETIAPGLGKVWKKYKTHWENENFIVTWGYGHLFELRTPEEYGEEFAEWSLEEYPCLPGKHELVLKRERDEKGKIIDFEQIDPGIESQYNFLAKMIKSSEIDEIISAGDPDTEGEAIVNDIIEETLEETILENSSNKKFTRMWFLDTTAKTIQDSYKNRKDLSETYGWCESARARRISDWIYGMNGSVLISSKYFTNSYVSVGRVQTPLLKLIVDREKAIRNFVPEKYFVTRGEFKTSKGIKYVGTLINDKNENIKSKTELKIKNLDDAKIINLTKTKKKTKAPKMYSTSSARKDISKKLKISTKAAEEVMQKLYEKEMISYPRAETEHIPDTMVSSVQDRLKNVMNILPNKPYNQVTVDKNNKNVFLSTDTGKIGSHYAIIPTLENNYDKLTDLEKSAFEIIADRFLMAMMPDYEYLNTTMITQITSGERFKTSGNATVTKGWKELDKVSKDQDLPVVEKGEIVKTLGFKDEENWTKAPSRFQDSDLEDLMKFVDRYIEDKELKKILKENSGLGTPATRPDIVQRLYNSKLLLTEKVGKITYVYPSEKGEILVEVAPSMLSNPVTTANWQVDLDELKDSGTAYDFVDNITKEFVDICTNIKEDTKAAVSISNVKNSIAKCPVCTGDLFETKKGYSCSNWNNETKPCKFTVWKNALEKLGKKTLTKAEVTKLIKDKKISVTLKSQKDKSTYKKDYELIIDKENNTFKFEIKWESNTPKKASVGKCPICKEGDMIDNPKGYSCSNWNHKTTPCKFTIWKNALDRFKGKLTKKNVENLLTKGEDLVKIETKQGKVSKKITIDEKYGIKINF